MAPSAPRGVIAAIATAIDPHGEPDCGRSIALARHLLAHGCDGLNVLGTTGEATSFSAPQRQNVMNAYHEAGLPLSRCLVGTGAAAVADAIALTAHAAELGFGGALLLPPFYYKNVADDGLFVYVERIVAATAARPIPLYLYHFPALSSVPWPLPLIGRMIEAFGPRIRGLKDFLRRYELCPRGRSDCSGFRRLPLDRGSTHGSPGGSFRRVYFGDRQSQFRPLRARLPCGRRRRPGARKGNSQPPGRHPADCRRQDPPCPYPCRPRVDTTRAPTVRPE